MSDGNCVEMPQEPPVTVQSRKRGRGRPKKAPDSLFFSTDDDCFVSWLPSTKLQVEVLGKPMAWARAFRGRNNNTFNPQKKEQAQLKLAVQQLCNSRIGSVPKFEVDVPLQATLEFGYYSPTNNVAYPKKADIDNLSKFVLDSLNGVLYDDDKQVVRLNATKSWQCAKQPGLITITLQKYE